MTWEQIKILCQTFYSQYVGSSLLIDPDSGSPSQLALFLDLVHNKIANYPQDFEFTKVTSTITLTGASSYNLKTLFPDLISVYQIYGIYDNSEHEFLPNNIANITSGDGYTIKGKTLYFTGTAPTSGTAKIQYKSKYLVEDSSGNRKRYFENDDDISVLDNPNLLIFGLGEFIDNKSDSKDKGNRDNISKWFQEAWTELINNPIQTKQVDSIL